MFNLFVLLFLISCNYESNSNKKKELDNNEVLTEKKESAELGSNQKIKQK